MESIRVATWNLERASTRSWKRAPVQNERIRHVAADIWVLTETFVDRSPGSNFAGVFSPPHPDRRPNRDERWTAIWSRWPCERLTDPVAHRRGSVTARIATPLGPLHVYGTVIAYGHEPQHDDGRSAKAWEVHAAEIERQGAEWLRLRSVHPDVPLIVAGDFNQGRSGEPYSYGPRALRERTTELLGEADLQCVTETSLLDSGQISDRPHVEHICCSKDLQQVGPVMAWDRADGDGVRLSDHPTIAVDLALQPD